MENTRKTLVISNAFAVPMIPQAGAPDTYSITRISDDDARKMVREADEIKSVIGHADTANIVGEILGIEIEANRINFTLDPAKHPMRGNPNPPEIEQLLVAQYTGPRLAEGTTTLPAGAKITFWYIEWFTEYELI